MKKMKLLFTDSLHEIQNMRAMAAAAMLLAIAVVLGFYSLQVTEAIRIGFSYIAKELSGMFFGPVVGSMVGGLSDVLAYIVKPTGPYFPGFTISAILAGLIYGVVLYKKPLRLGRVIVANALVTVFINLILNTYWLTMLYGNAYMALLPARTLKQLIMLPIEVALYYSVAKILTKANVFAPTGTMKA